MHFQAGEGWRISFPWKPIVVKKKYRVWSLCIFCSWRQSKSAPCQIYARETKYFEWWRTLNVKKCNQMTTHEQTKEIPAASFFSSSSQHHTLNITHPTSHTQHHIPNITHSTSHTQHHTLNITYPTSHTPNVTHPQHRTLNIAHTTSRTQHRSTSHTQHHTPNITHTQHHSLTITYATSNTQHHTLNITQST